jgi:transglutaminase-like putative cysteine protease
MLLQANCLKLLIASTARHLKTTALLNFFLSSCIFLFYQSLTITLMVFVLFVINFSALYLLQNDKGTKKSGQKALGILGLSLPIATLLFLFLPKLPAFWKMPNLSTAEVGLNESVNPFNISNLTKSDKLAFRAEIPNQFSPPYYWRTMVHEQFDGKTWHIADTATKQVRIQKEDSANKSNNVPSIIKIYHEKTQLKWLPSQSFSVATEPNIVTTINGNLLRKKTSNQSFTYQFEYQPLRIKDNANMVQTNLSLPSGANPSAVKIARELAWQSQNTQELINNLAAYYFNNGFIYTLKPPIYNNRHTIDSFLTEGKQGFCGHYASASAFIFRAAGVPARVVSGYLGGERATDGEFLSVYNYDAHAWTEVWQENIGWTRFDATSYVEPDRLNGSLSQLNTTREQFNDNIGFGLTSLSEIAVFNYLRLQLAQLDYKWTAWVLSFDNTSQQKLIKKLIDKVSPLKIAGIVMATIGLFLISVLMVRLWRSKSQHTDKLAYYLAVIEGVGERQNIARNKGETVQQFFARLSTAMPKLNNELTQFLSIYNQNRYGEKPLTQAQFKTIKRTVKNIKNKRQL